MLLVFFLGGGGGGIKKMSELKISCLKKTCLLIHVAWCIDIATLLTGVIKFYVDLAEKSWVEMATLHSVISSIICVMCIW